MLFFLCIRITINQGDEYPNVSETRNLVFVYLDGESGSDPLFDHDQKKDVSNPFSKAFLSELTKTLICVLCIVFVSFSGKIRRGFYRDNERERTLVKL